MAAILVVDDEAGIREFLSETLIGDGHDVVKAGDGAEAMSRIHDRTFDLMITDLRMPGHLDGVELLRLARVEQPHLEVVVLTAHGTVASAVEAMKLGAFDYLEKPLGSPSQLRMMVRRGLTRRSAHARDRVDPAPGGDQEQGDPVACLARDLGRALGPSYVVGDVIGRGGLAVVFRVSDRRLDRELAVKVLHPEYGAVASIAEQFRREARTAARLNHPNIVPVYFVGRESDVPCLVMPLIQGETLRSRLDRERTLPVDEALRIAADVAAALDFAHAAQVVHRDVKPDNILIDRASGRALLTDFGIAKAISIDPGSTAPGMMVGTPYYVSPEQAAGDRQVDHRSDEYSFGVVIYEMLAGVTPFRDEPNVTPQFRRVLMEHVIAPYPSLLAFRPELGARFDRVLERALAKDPAHRFESAAELVAALTAALPGKG